MFGPDQIYLNVSINPASTTTNSLVEYDESFSRSILSESETWYLAVARMSFPTSEIPIFFFPVNVAQNNPLVSAMVISIRTAGLTVFSQTVNFIAQNNQPVPVAGVAAPYFTTSQVTSKYYAIFSPRAFITMINTALAAAITASALGVTAPYYVYDSSTELISLVSNAGFQATGATIHLNENLNNYLSGFQFYQETAGSITEYQHVLTPLAVGYTFIADNKCMGLWFDIRKIILKSNNLPVVQEIVPTQNSRTGLTEGVIDYSPILTDFLISYDSISQLSGYANYTPDTYRLISMTRSTAPINKLNLQFFWLTKTGIEIPLEMSSTQTCTLKLAFLKKSLYNNNY